MARRTQSHANLMLDRPWLARHAMRRHGVDFLRFRERMLTTVEFTAARAAARALYDAKDSPEAVAAVERMESARASGTVDPVVVAATHERLDRSAAPDDIDATYVMRAMRDDHVRRDLHATFLRQSRLPSYGAIALALVLGVSAIALASRSADRVRANYIAALHEHELAQPKSWADKARGLIERGKGFVAERTGAKARKETDLINSIRRERGENPNPAAGANP